MGLLDGRVALITGAARGQGRSHAVRFAGEGADIIAIDICENDPLVNYDLASQEDLDETARLVEAEDRRVIARRADVRDVEGLAKVVAEGVAELGRLDFILANAGIGIYRTGEPSWEVPNEHWEANMGVNATGVFNTLKAGIPAIIEGGRGGSIVLTSSTGGLEGIPQLIDYTASKHAVVGIMRTMAKELAQYDIRINSVHPTGVATPMIENAACERMLEANPAQVQNFTNLIDVDAVSPSDISDSMLFLCSDNSRYITGHTLPVDAGHMAK
jgi:SDR family mycofactocin-dependent oxidoreductase